MKSRAEIADTLQDFLKAIKVRHMSDDTACKILAFSLNISTLHLNDMENEIFDVFQADVTTAAYKLNMLPGDLFHIRLFSKFISLFQELEKNGRATSWLPEIYQRYNLAQLA